MANKKPMSLPKFGSSSLGGDFLREDVVDFNYVNDKLDNLKKYEKSAHTLTEKDIGLKIMKIKPCSTPTGYPDMSFVGETYTLKAFEYGSPLEGNCRNIRCGVITNLQCSRCKKAFYCSKECQKKCWLLHKDICDDYIKKPEKELKFFILTNENGKDTIVDRDYSYYFGNYIYNWVIV